MVRELVLARLEEYQKMRSTLLLAVFASASFLTPTISASVLGSLNEANCNPNGGVTITNTSIKWLPTTGGGTGGCINAGPGTNLSWSTGVLTGATLGITGNILNLPPNAPVTGFMTFTGMAGGPLSFDLGAIPSPVVSAGLCNSAQAAVTGSTCVATATSPFVVTNLGAGNISVSLSVNGTIKDPGVPSQVSTWDGSFSTQINQSPLGIYNIFNGGSGTLTSTQSGQFNASAAPTVPEPGTVGMILIGGLLLASAKRRRAKVQASSN
jgi:hypothetical protein